MRLNGNLSVAGQVKDLKIEQLAVDPVAPVLSQMWYNTTDSEMKFFDGVVVQVIATGAGALADYLLLDGTAPMVGALTLNSADQSAAADTVAVSKGHVDTVAGTKEDTITGAATSIVAADLAVSAIATTDASGKVSATTSATAAEAEFLAGVTSGIQGQLDGKEASIGYVPVNKAGDSMGGNIAMAGNAITGLIAAAGPTEPVRQAEFEAALAGLDFQADVLGVQTDASLDPSATPTLGDRYVITDTAALHANFGTITGVENNDIVEFDGTDFIVSYDVSVLGEGILAWDQLLDVFIRFDGTSWSEFGGLSGVTAGIGLAKSGNNIYVNMGAGVAQLPSDEIGLDVKADGGIDIVDPTTGLHSVLTDAQVALKLDGATLSTSTDGVKVDASGITELELNASIIGNGIQGAAGTAISVKTLAASGITVDTDGVSVDDVELRTRALYLDGAAAMTGELTLSSNDQTLSADEAAVSKAYMIATIGTLAGDAVTTLETRVNAGYFVYDGTGAANTSHTVTHNMGNKYVQVSIVDTSDEVVLPESITFTDVNSLAVTFTNAEAVRIIVTGLKAAA